MTAKLITHTALARGKLLTGVSALADVVKLTLGPGGRRVVLGARQGPPVVTHDGAAVAVAVELEDRLANLGARLVREAAEATRALVGDGSTTATVLADALYREGARLLAAGHDPIHLKRGIEQASNCVVAALTAMARPAQGTTELAQVAAMSAHGDRSLGDQLAEAVERVGVAGVIVIEESQGTDTTLELVEGARLDGGYLSPYFVTDTKRGETRFEDAYVLVSERKLSTTWELVPLLEQLAKAAKPLLIVADDIEGDALSTLIVNKLRGTVDCVAVKAPSFGDRRKEALRDLAVLTGAQTVSEELGSRLEDLTLAALGRARRVTVDQDSTTVVGDGSSRARVTARVASLRAELARASSPLEQQRLEGRVAKLGGGVAVLRVGGFTALSMKETKARAEGALCALRAAAREGLVPGGGVALVRAQAALDTLVVERAQRAGVSVVRRALEAPLRQLAKNAGEEPSPGAVLGEHLIAGVMDPLGVVRSAFQKAASIATLMLTSECLIALAPARQ